VVVEKDIDEIIQFEESEEDKAEARSEEISRLDD